MTRARLVRFFVPAAIAGVIAGLVVARPHPIRIEGPVPERLADTTFWRMFTELSEPSGYFHSENFVSNETALQYVIPDLRLHLKPGGVYLGVGPEQNLTYLAAFQPRIAFIIDIRRQNAMEHLMYKALLETSADRPEFVSRLFSRRRPPGLGAAAPIAEVFAAFDRAPADSLWRDSSMDVITHQLREVHHFPVSDEDLATIEYVHRSFYRTGPGLTYSNSGVFARTNGPRTGARGPNPGGSPRFRGGFSRAMPTYEQLMEETDGRGAERSYLATETDFLAVKNLESRNLVVPVVGDFAGKKAVRAVGTWLRQHDATVSAFYTSNVEQYLFQQGDDWNRFNRNVATLPIDSSSTFIRSATARMARHQQNPAGSMAQFVLPVRKQLDAFSRHQLQTYQLLIEMSQ